LGKLRMKIIENKKEGGKERGGSQGAQGGVWRKKKCGTLQKRLSPDASQDLISKEKSAEGLAEGKEGGY